MKISSSAQLELDYPDTESGSAAENTTFTRKTIGTYSEEDPSASSGPLNIPDFGGIRAAYAVTSRIAGRINAASVSEQEHRSLLQERQKLLDKMLGDTITPQQANRLEYVRWSLDRIEDAKYGQQLDVLDDYVAKYEAFLKEIGSFKEQLQQRMPKKRK